MYPQTFCQRTYGIRQRSLTAELLESIDHNLKFYDVKIRYLPNSTFVFDFMKAHFISISFKFLVSDKFSIAVYGIVVTEIT